MDERREEVSPEALVEPAAVEVRGAGAATLVRSEALDEPRRVQIRQSVEWALLERKRTGRVLAMDGVKSRKPPGSDRGPGPERRRKRRRAGRDISDVAGVEYIDVPVPEQVKHLSGVIGSIPRRKFASTSQGDMASPPPMAKLDFKASSYEVMVRGLIWFWALITFGLGTLWDAARQRNTEERRAARLVKTFQRIGGTIIKIGQQLSMRVDVLPYVYCREMSKLLDTVPPFPPEQAIATIEKALGKPLDEVFTTFDPVPIGSASIACVYQGVLKSGEKVAVKVRRPRIGRVFAADLRALRWLLTVIESLTMIRPGLLRNFLRDFELSIMEELDFRSEARYQELFRRYAKKKSANRRNSYFTAPKIYFDLSGMDIIVQQFTSGIWAWEIIAAVEQNDQAALARMRELNIDPRVVAERLCWASAWSTMQHFMFHADPHPANIVVKANNEIVFIDFGACGSNNTSKREIFLEMLYHQNRKDIHGVVQCAMALLEPLPHIDVDEFEKELELVLMQAMYKQWSKHSVWFERTSAYVWLSIFEMTRNYELSVNLDTVRSFRANMLYDSLAIRICNDVEPADVALKFSNDVAVLAAKRVKNALWRRVRRGPTNQDLALIEDAMTSGSRALFRLKRFLSRQVPNFSFMVEKSVFSVLMIIQMALSSLLLFIATCLGVGILRYWHGERLSASLLFWTVITNGWFQGAIAVLGLISLRRILFRLNDRATD